MLDIVHPEASRHNHEVTWRKPSRGEHFRRCSYCGSIHPDDLVAEPSWIAEWADRKYGYPHKFYVNIPNRDPEKLVPMGSGPANTYADWTNTEDLTNEQKVILTEHGYGDPDPGRSYNFAPKKTHYAKFYTIHLKDADLSLKVKDEINRRSGLIIVFDSEGMVRWIPYPHNL